MTQTRFKKRKGFNENLKKSEENITTAKIISGYSNQKSEPVSICPFFFFFAKVGRNQVQVKEKKQFKSINMEKVYVGKKSVLLTQPFAHYWEWKAKIVFTFPNRKGCGPGIAESVGRVVFSRPISIGDRMSGEGQVEGRSRVRQWLCLFLEIQKHEKKWQNVDSSESQKILTSKISSVPEDIWKIRSILFSR